MALRRIKYVGPHREVEFQNGTGEWVTVKRNGHVDLPTRQANEMAEQEDNWVIVDTSKDDDPKPAAKADTADKKDEG